VKCLELGREVCVGCLVCGSLVAEAGSEDYRDDGAEGVEAGGDIGGRARNDGRIHGSRKDAKAQREKSGVDLGLGAKDIASRKGAKARRRLTTNKCLAPSGTPMK
jgi:hypothetical protein